MKTCVMYQKKKQKCRSGFDQSNVCRGLLIGFKGDYDNIANIPQCCNEERCGRLYSKSGGKPEISFYHLIDWKGVIDGN